MMCPIADKITRIMKFRTPGLYIIFPKVNAPMAKSIWSKGIQGVPGGMWMRLLMKLFVKSPSIAPVPQMAPQMSGVVENGK